MSNQDRTRSAPRSHLPAIVLIVLAALIVGLPTLHGGFVGGDDRRLVLNHVLVNHPSIAHALKLFTIIHRDLYQPIPLLSFSLEFAIASRLGLFEQGLSGATWLFHLTNVLLHAANALLVWWVIVTWQGGTGRLAASSVSSPGAANRSVPTFTVAAIAAVLFAVHPLQVEVTAWLNGRMMLLSTLFALGSVVALGRWLRSARVRWGLIALLLVTLCGMSKLRVGLPVVLVLLPLATGYRPTRRLLLFWLASFAVMGVLGVVNVFATAQAGMFAGAIENLHGSRLARTVMALGWYFQHYVWPTGLAAWYPTPPTVAWSDAVVWRGMAIVFPIVGAAIWTARRSRVALIGFGWFFVTIAATLPWIPTRNILAADRYMYLPIVGLVWLTAHFLWKLHGAVVAKWSGAWVRAGTFTIILAALGGLIATSRYTASFYETYVSKTMRLAMLFPDTPYVWERVAWAYQKVERYEDAIDAARKEFIHDDPELHSDATLVIGVSQLRMGRSAEAIDTLRRAVSLDPRNHIARYRLASALEELGRTEEALPVFEQALSEMPLFNPGLVKLAGVYRALGRPEDARALYRQVLTNNPYDVPASLGLAELDLDRGTRASLDSAEARLRRLLDWMPENVAARTNLGVVLVALGREDQAIEAYQTVLRHEPRHVTAALNLAQLLHRKGRIQHAAALFAQVAPRVETIAQAVAVHDFYILQGEPLRAVKLWSSFLAFAPESAGARVFLAWSLALAGDLARAKAILPPDATAPNANPEALVLATRTYLALSEGRYEDARRHAQALTGAGARGSDARRRLLGALGMFDERHPQVPWTFCLAARLLITDAQTAAATMSIDLCDQRCAKPACREEVRRLREALPE